MENNSTQSGGMFSSNKEMVRKLVEEELRGKVPRNKSFKQAVGAGFGGREQIALSPFSILCLTINYYCFPFWLVFKC